MAAARRFLKKVTNTNRSFGKEQGSSTGWMTTNVTERNSSPSLGTDYDSLRPSIKGRISAPADYPETRTYDPGSATAYVKSALTCPICQDEYKNPRGLPCMHSFCLDCIQRYISVAVDENKISCPVCRAVCVVPSGDAITLPHNYLISNIQGYLEQGEDHVNTCQTSACRQEATVFCGDGCGELCHHCASHHRRMKITEKHNVISLKDVTDDKDMICEEHTEKSVDYYCKDCEKSICAFCSKRGHKNHRMYNLRVTANNYKTTLKGLCELMQEYINAADECMDFSVREHENLKKRVHDYKRYIHKQTDTLHSQIDRSKAELLNRLDQLSIEVNNTFSDTVRKQLTLSRDMKKKIASAERVMGYVPDTTVTQQAKILIPEIGESLQYPIPLCTAQIKVFGSNSTSLPLGVVKKIENIESGHIYPSIPLKRYQLRKEGILLAGLTVMDGCIWYMYKNSSTLFGMQPNGETTASFPISGLVDSNGVVQFPCGRLHMVISEGSENKLIWIEFEIENHIWKIENTKPQKLDYHPGTLTASCDGELIVTEPENKIHIYNDEGHELHVINTGSTVSTFKAIKDPSSGYYAVLDQTNKSIIWVAQDGEAQRAFTKEQFAPVDFTLYDKSVILVADAENNRIHSIGLDGNDNGFALSERESLRSPCSIITDDELDQFFVVEKYTDNKIMELLKVEYHDQLKTKITTKKLNIELHISSSGMLHLGKYSVMLEQNKPVNPCMLAW